jgi:predicted TIM-barrel fold metal-dependent hydrolase
MGRAALSIAFCAALLGPPALAPALAQDSGAYRFNDSHFHLTNYIQEGLTAKQYMDMVRDTVKRSTLFGIPLQQTWDYANSGDFAPTYYLQTDAPLYYYAFTDAMIAHEYLSLPEGDRARLDPMITGFNPADMYAVDHIRRVLLMYPGVFSGIGEFSVHKEFVSSKVAGEVATLPNKALDRIFEFTAEAGLLSILHCDIDMPFTKGKDLPVYYTQMRELLLRHPNATIIWAHTGLGRVVRPIPAQASAEPGTERPPGHIDLLELMLDDPQLNHVYFDISWDEVAKYAVSSPETAARVAALFNRHADRFLFGTDNVAPASLENHMAVFEMWNPVFDQLTPETKQSILFGNYERLFDAARAKVRAWEQANAAK